MDYYDYNVINASAAPGSYLGMDPAFLVWIPPIDDGNIINEIEDEDQSVIYDEILPMPSADPGSNTESPDDEIPKVPSKPPRKNLKSPSTEESKPLTIASRESLKTDPLTIKEEFYTKLKSIQAATSSQPKHPSKYLYRDCARKSDTVDNLEAKVSHLKPDTKRISIIEKETSVIKSPSDNKISEYYELSDIKFADDEDLDDGSNKIYKDTNLQCQ